MALFVTGFMVNVDNTRLTDIASFLFVCLMIKGASVIWALALICCLFYKDDIPSSAAMIEIGSGGYDIQPISITASASVLDKDSIRRLLLNNFKTFNVLELAAQISLPPMDYPMKRVSDDMLASAEVEEQQRRELAQFLRDGFKVTNADCLCKVLGYNRLYRSGEANPVQLMRKTLETVVQWEKEGYIIFSSLIAAEVMSQAAESEYRYQMGKSLSVFDGVPIVFSSPISIKGMCLLTLKIVFIE